MGSDEAPLLVPFPIGRYRDTSWPELDVDAEVGRLHAILAAFGCEHLPWSVPPEERGSDAVTDRLRLWNQQWPRRDTIIYWLGHGYRDSQTALLAHYLTDQRHPSGIIPAQIGNELGYRGDGEAQPPWTLVIIDACTSATFVQQLTAYVTGQTTARRLLLFGTSGDGQTRLGELSRQLDQTLRTHYARNDRIPLAELVSQLETDGLRGAYVASLRMPADAALVRRHAPVPVTAPVDLAAEVEQAINALSETERLHFVRPLRGGEAGDLSWYFTGRATEQRRIAGWLREHDHGLLPVIGDPGVGKSALLGQVLVQSRPPMRTVLAQLGLHLTADQEGRPDDDVFTAALLLTGFDRRSLALAIAEAGGLPAVPPHNDPRLLADWLADGLPPVTLLVDALDEAQEPEVVAMMLARIAERSGIRVIVGTRPTTSLLEALGDQPAIRVEYDESTAVEYVVSRLTHAFPELPAKAALTSARQIAGGGRDFLFARLAVGELLDRPALLTDPTALDAVLARGRGGIFADWLDRVSAEVPAVPRLLLALAFMRGRGLPSAASIWATVAEALTDGPRITTNDIAATVRRHAAGYLVADLENGATVYRLAHNVYQQVLRERHRADEAAVHLVIVRALLRLAGNAGDAPPPYLIAYLSAHAAAAGQAGWRELAGRPRILDLLDGARLRTDLIRDALGTPDLPAEIRGATAAGHLLATARHADRRGIREVAMARYAGVNRFSGYDDRDSWSLDGAWLARETTHAMVGRHHGLVHALTAFTGMGRTRLVSAGDDGVIRLIDSATGQVDRLGRHGGPVWALTTVPEADGRHLVVSGGADGTIRFWDPYRRRSRPEPLVGHVGRVRALAAVATGDRLLLVSGGEDRLLRVWDLKSHELLFVCAGHEHWIMAVTAFTSVDGQPLVATAGRDRHLRIWDPLTGEPRGVLSGHTDWVYDVTSFTGRGHQSRLASAGGEGRIRIWDPQTCREVQQPLRVAGPDGMRAVHTVASCTGVSGAALLVSGGDDRIVRIWDPNAGEEILVDPERKHRRGIRAVAVFSDQRQFPVVASAGHDHDVRVWNPYAEPPSGTAGRRHIGRVLAVAVYPRRRRQMLASVGADRKVRIWSTSDAEQAGDFIAGHRGAINAVLAATDPSGAPCLVTTGRDRTVRMWEPGSGRQIGEANWRHTAEVLTLAGFRTTAGEQFVVSAGVDKTVALWALNTRGPRLRAVLEGHSGWIRAAAVFRANDGSRSVRVATGGDDSTIRLWDPLLKQEADEPIRVRAKRVLSLAAYEVGGRWLIASGWRDGTLHLFDPASRQPAATPARAHASGVSAVTTFTTPAGRLLLVTGGWDRTVRLWDPLTLTPVAVLPLQVTVNSLAVAGHHIVVAAVEGVLLVHPGPLPAEHRPALG
ncbi:hypothetical protein [Micromonospora sp. NPDC047527]|uniref:hypothetical protein n=1 Tax=Micromonospora sp. NPDC047527 TaxID=3155144 RepID=UPI0033CD2E75